MRATHIQTGLDGEDLAMIYLQERGFDIKHRNWRFQRYEIDIIAEYGDTIHFIEVKARRNKKYGLPEESVNRKKISNMLIAAEAYLLRHPGHFKVQHDILSILLKDSGEPEYLFIEDIYL